MTTANLVTMLAPVKPLQPGDLVTLWWESPNDNTGFYEGPGNVMVFRGPHRMRSFNSEGKTVWVMPGDSAVFLGSDDRFFQVLHPDLGPVSVISGLVKLVPVATEEN